MLLDDREPRIPPEVARSQAHRVEIVERFRPLVSDHLRQSLVDLSQCLVPRSGVERPAQLPTGIPQRLLKRETLRRLLAGERRHLQHFVQPVLVTVEGSVDFHEQFLTVHAPDAAAVQQRRHVQRVARHGVPRRWNTDFHAPVSHCSGNKRKFKLESQKESHKYKLW